MSFNRDVLNLEEFLLNFIKENERRIFDKNDYLFLSSDSDELFAEVKDNAEIIGLTARKIKRDHNILFVYNEGTGTISLKPIKKKKVMSNLLAFRQKAISSKKKDLQKLFEKLLFENEEHTGCNEIQIFKTFVGSVKPVSYCSVEIENKGDVSSEGVIKIENFKFFKSIADYDNDIMEEFIKDIYRDYFVKIKINKDYISLKFI